MLLPHIEFDLFYDNVGNSWHIWTIIVELLDGTFVLILVFVFFTCSSSGILLLNMQAEKQLFGVVGCA